MLPPLMLSHLLLRRLALTYIDHFRGARRRAAEQEIPGFVIGDTEAAHAAHKCCAEEGLRLRIDWDRPTLRRRDARAYLPSLSQNIGFPTASRKATGRKTE